LIHFDIYLLIPDFSYLYDACSNQGQLCVHLAGQKGILNANGVGVLVFLFLATTCFVKFHRETLVVLFAVDRYIYEE